MDEPTNPEVRAAPDAISKGPIWVIAIATLMLCAVLCVIAWGILRMRERNLRPSGRFPERQLGPPHEVAGVRADPYELPENEPSVKERQRAALGRYGWVDRAHGVVQIPVDDAYDLVLRP
jgi:hypothetical protein